MIMAGRGKRLGDLGQAPNVGVKSSLKEENFDLPTLIDTINEIHITDVNENLLFKIKNYFIGLCKSKEVLSDTVSDLYNKALVDLDFGHRLMIVIEQVISFSIDDVNVRYEILTKMQNDFESKDLTSKSDKKKFLNSVMLLGIAYQRIKINGKPLKVLDIALLQYFDFLLQGEEEDLKVLTTLILMNGQALSESEVSENYLKFHHTLRDILISKNLTDLSKCWILLSIDIMSNEHTSLKKTVKDFYFEKLGDDFKKLEHLFEVPKSQLNNSFSSPESIKSQDSGFVKVKQVESVSNKNDQVKKGLSKKLSNIKLSEHQSKDKSHYKNTKKDDRNWKSDEKSSKGYKGSMVSGHDDRFDKDENFYGVQMPRQPKIQHLKKDPKGLGDSSKLPSGTNEIKEPQTSQPSPKS